MKIRIGYDDADTLITYPYAHNLSACAQPIRVRGWIGPGRVHWLLRCNLSSPRPRPWSGFPTMSHAIPLRLLQTLNSRRWNCNVCGRFRLFGRPNCMRLLERVRLSCPERARRTREPSPRQNFPAQPINVDWWCTMTRRASPDVAGAHTLDSSDAPPSQRTR